MKKFSVSSSLMMAGLAMFLTSGNALAQSQTAQSAMVKIETDNTAYLIEGTITWTYDRDEAETYYTNAWDGAPPVVTVGTGSPQTSTGAPAPDANKLQQHAQAERCKFFFGGRPLTETSYTQTENGTRGWKWVYTYKITPNVATVVAHTAWTSAEEGGTVDIGFSGFVASESFQKQSTRNKYSFTMLDGGITRARNVLATLNKDNTLVKTIDLNNVDTDLDTVNDGLNITSATADFSYFGNGGIFGNSAVFGALHATSRKPANSVVNILNGIDDGSNSDNFAGNNNDLAAGNVHQGTFSDSFDGLTEEGNYTIVVSGALKGNSSSADFGFGVTSNIAVVGGCTQ